MNDPPIDQKFLHHTELGIHRSCLSIEKSQQGIDRFGLGVTYNTATSSQNSELISSKKFWLMRRCAPGPLVPGFSINFATAALALCFAISAILICAPAQAQGVPQRTSPRLAVPVTEVILLRGLFDVFSLGMDELGRKLAAQRFRVKVYGHGAWNALADDIIARRRAGEAPSRLVLIGHSLGANDIILMAAKLGEAAIGVDLLIPIDATAPTAVPQNVRHVVNYYQSSNGLGSVVLAGPGFRGNLTNANAAGNRRDLASSNLGHITIDKSERVHREIVGLVSALSSPRRARQRVRAN